MRVCVCQVWCNFGDGCRPAIGAEGLVIADTARPKLKLSLILSSCQGCHCPLASEYLKVLRKKF